MKENLKIMAFSLLFHDIQIDGTGSTSLWRDVRVKWLLTDAVTSDFTPVITSACGMKRYIMSSAFLS